MKLFLLVVLCFILIGCRNDSEKPSLITEHPTRLETLGEFYRYKEINDIGTYETGPITVTIESAETVNGNLQDTIEVPDEERKIE